jgi:retron-type reverse transcriptase
MSNRYIQLAFDGEKTEKTAIEIGILQGSPVSPILFLIYIRFLFEEIKDIRIRILSYLDDIAILAKLESLENNY